LVVGFGEVVFKVPNVFDGTLRIPLRITESVESVGAGSDARVRQDHTPQAVLVVPHVGGALAAWLLDHMQVRRKIVRVGCDARCILAGGQLIR